MPSLVYKPVTYTPHTCGPACLQVNDPTQFPGNYPLRVPLYMGFERHMVHAQNYQSNEITCYIQYRCPCGKMLRNLTEVARYLVLTKCALTIDYFSTDENVTAYPQSE